MVDWKRLPGPIGDTPPVAHLLYGLDAQDALLRVDAASVHMVCTSPPYWNLRDYDSPDQIGLEESPEQYIDRLVSVFHQVKRTLRPDGTLWLVVVGRMQASNDLS